MSAPEAWRRRLVGRASKVVSVNYGAASSMARAGAATLAHPTRKTLFYMGIAPGDDLLCSAAIHEYRRRHATPVWMMSDHPEIFASNPDVARVVAVDRRYLRWMASFGAQVRRLEYFH